MHVFVWCYFRFIWLHSVIGMRSPLICIVKASVTFINGCPHWGWSAWADQFRMIIHRFHTSFIFLYGKINKLNRPCGYACLHKKDQLGSWSSSFDETTKKLIEDKRMILVDPRVHTMFIFGWSSRMNRLIVLVWTRLKVPSLIGFSISIYRFFNFNLKRVWINIQKWSCSKFSRKFSKQISHNFEKNIRKFRELFRKIWENNFQKWFRNYWKIFRIIWGIILENLEKYFGKFFKLVYFKMCRKLFRKFPEIFLRIILKFLKIFWKISRIIAENFEIHFFIKFS